jgi:pimeloyl-ACP methyl ester carboxylesterase
MRDSSATLGAGRRIAYTDIGDPNGRCIFFFHGAPTSRLHLVGLDRQLAARGLRVISPDRPGYGQSSPHPGRSLLDWPADVAGLAAALGIARCAVAGHSSGGSYAVACAALLPLQVSGALVIAGVTDMAWPEAWRGYLEPEAELMRMNDEQKALAWCVEHFGADGSRFLEAAAIELPEPDLAFLTDERTATELNASIAEGFRQGVVGYAQDTVVQGQPWRFDPGSIAVRVDVVHGDLDTVLPIAHSRHTAELIPGATLRTLRGHGHLSILAEFPDLAAALVSST